jgi:hypothetical protein
MKKYSFVIALSIVVLCSFSFGQVPQKISYQGMLTTSSGTPVQNGSYSFQFKLYTTASGGSALWTETQVGVSVSRGVFNVFLGSVTPFNVSFNMPLFLEVITIGGPGILEPLTMLPRSEFTSSPYALWADTARYAIVTVPTGNAGGDLTGTFPNPVIANNVVTSNKILDSTIQRVDVKNNFKAPYSDTADYAKGALLEGDAGGDLTGIFPNPVIKDSAITSAKILDGTIQREDVQPTFKAPYSDSADYAKSASPGGDAGGDLTGIFPNPAIKDSVITSAKILDSTIQREDVQPTFKSPYADTADYARVLSDTGAYLPVAGGVMKGAITNIGNPPITMGKGNFGSGNINSGDYAFTAGLNNQALGKYSVVSGGGPGNISNDTSATVAGGSYNSASGEYATIGGGKGNLIQKYPSNPSYSTIGGGVNNVIKHVTATIGGGINNMIDDSGPMATISGGSGNYANYPGATIGGGYNNRAVLTYGTVGGGLQNNAYGAFTTISGGENNVASNYAAVGGGKSNNANGSFSTIGGGELNKATGIYSFIGGGGGSVSPADSNSALGDYSVIVGGRGNKAIDTSTTVSGGSYNIASSGYATIGGGKSNWIKKYPVNGEGAGVTISGGIGNYVDGSQDGYDYYPINYSTISGGQNNSIRNNTASTIGGGSGNQILTPRYNWEGSTISGGTSNQILAGNSTIGGGANNQAFGTNATVAGGKDNSAGHLFIMSGYTSGSTVGGGENNEARSNYGTVSGGKENFAGQSVHHAATVSGGQYNRAENDYSTVPGGFQNTAWGGYSFAAGRRAKALYQGTFVWGDATDDDVSSERDNQFRVRANGGARFDVNNNRWVNIWDDGTNLINTSTGGRLTLGGVWTNSSDKNKKENFSPVVGKVLLEKLSTLPISMWNYKNESRDIKHIGPMAQDFYQTFKLGGDDKTISTVDPSGIALAAIQELYKQNKELSSQNDELKIQNEKIMERLSELELTVKSLASKKHDTDNQSLSELKK